MSLSFQNEESKIRKKDKIMKNTELYKADMKNQQLLRTLKTKMFAGYHQVKESNKPKDHVKMIIKQEEMNYYPLSENFNIFYKNKYIKPYNNKYNFYPSFKVDYLGKNKELETNQVDTSKEKNQASQTNDDSNNNDNNSKSLNQSLVSDTSQSSLYNKVYLNTRERNLYNPFPFISVYKNTSQNNTMAVMTKSNSQKSFYGQKAIKRKLFGDKNKKEILNKRIADERFLFMLSHNEKEIPDSLKDNYLTNKGLFHVKTMTNLFKKSVYNIKDTNYNREEIQDFKIGKRMEIKTLMKNSFYNKYKFNSNDLYLNKYFDWMEEGKRPGSFITQARITNQKNKETKKGKDVNQKSTGNEVNPPPMNNEDGSPILIINNSILPNNLTTNKNNNSPENDKPQIQKENKEVNVNIILPPKSKSQSAKKVKKEEEVNQKFIPHRENIFERIKKKIEKEKSESPKKFKFTIPENSHLLYQKKIDGNELYKRNLSAFDQLIVNLLEKSFSHEEMQRNFTQDSFPLIFYEKKKQNHKQI